MPVILEFDAKTGKALSQQELRPIQKQESVKFSLPWRAGHMLQLGQKEAAMRSALQVLHMLHACSAYDSLPIDIISDTSKNLKHVEATDNIKSSVCHRAFQKQLRSAQNPATHTRSRSVWQFWAIELCFKRKAQPQWRTTYHQTQ